MLIVSAVLSMLLFLFGFVINNDLVVSAVQILTATGVVEGKSCTAYPAVGPEITRAGGKYVATPVDQAHVHGNLITAPAWPAHPAWLAAFLRALGTRIEL